MAPTAHAAEIAGRQVYTCPSGYYYSSGYCYSRWNWWGRWVFLGVVVVFFIIVFFLLACLSNRRRRRRGLQPYYGMGWAGNGPKYTYNQNNPAAYQAPPPQYSAQPVQGQYTGQTFSPNDGYYGNHEGIQLQQPASSYQRGAENVYQPPAGPPPKKY